jgi:TolB protein
MTDQGGFELRLADAFERYAAEAPAAVDVPSLVAAVMHGRSTRAEQRWPRLTRPTVRVLLAAALLATLLATMLSAALLRPPPDPYRGARLLVADGRTAWVLGPGLEAQAHGQVLTHNSCPTLIGGGTVLAVREPTAWRFASLSPGDALPDSAPSLDHRGFEVWSPSRTSVAVVDADAGSVAVAEVGRSTMVGSGRQGFTVPARDVVAAAWSLDEERLALLRHEGTGAALQFEIYEVKGGAVEPWVSVAIPNDAPGPGLVVTLAWAPDGGRVAVGIAAGREARDGAVHLIRLDPATVATISDGRDGILLVGDAAWAPDSSRLALVAGPDLSLRDEAGDVVATIAGDPVGRPVRELRWWPDGERLLMRTDRSLVSSRSDGSGRAVRPIDAQARVAIHAGDLYVARRGRGLQLDRYGPDDHTPTSVALLGTTADQAVLPDTVCLDAQAPSRDDPSGRPLEARPITLEGEEPAMPTRSPKVSRTAAAVMAASAIASAGSAPVGAADPDSPSPLPSAVTIVLGEEPWIAYQSATGKLGGAHGIHLVRPDGSGAMFVGGALPRGGEQLHPDWSPDGRRILLDAADTDGTYDLWVIDLDSMAAERIVDCVTPCLWVQEAAWAPDGERIALQRHSATDEGEVSTVEIVDLASGESTTVFETDATLGIYAPRWSPDGASLVLEIVGWDGGDFIGDSLQVLDLADPGVTRTIVPMDMMGNNPDWSPRGDLIAFSAPAAGGEPGGALSDIWVVAPDGTGMRQVTHLAAEGGTAVQPAFTPDGSRILFKGSGGDVGRQDVIASIAIDGSDLGPATGEDYIGGWHPRMRPTPD